MKKQLAATAVVLLCGVSAVHADERAGGAAVGAVSGALILGPVGAVAGAAIGYVAGASAKASKPKRIVSRPARRGPATAAASPRPAGAGTATAPTATTPTVTTGTASPEPRKSAERPDPATPPMQGFD